MRGVLGGGFRVFGQALAPRHDLACIIPDVADRGVPHLQRRQRAWPAIDRLQHKSLLVGIEHDENPLFRRGEAAQRVRQIIPRRLLQAEWHVEGELKALTDRVVALWAHPRDLRCHRLFPLWMTGTVAGATASDHWLYSQRILDH